MTCGICFNTRLSDAGFFARGYRHDRQMPQAVRQLSNQVNDGWESE